MNGLSLDSLRELFGRVQLNSTQPLIPSGSGQVLLAENPDRLAWWIGVPTLTQYRISLGLLCNNDSTLIDSTGNSFLQCDQGHYGPMVAAQVSVFHGVGVGMIFNVMELVLIK